MRGRRARTRRLPLRSTDRDNWATKWSPSWQSAPHRYNQLQHLQIVDSFKKNVGLLFVCSCFVDLIATSQLFVFAACNLHCSCLHKQSLCDSMNFLFLSNLSRKYCCEKMFILKVFILIQLLSTANAKDIKTDYYITNSTLASRYHGSVT